MNRTQSAFARKLTSNAMTVIGELSPPAGFQLDAWLDDARALAGLVDCVQLTDMPGARAHMDSLVPAAALRQIGFDVMLTMTSRDRNSIAQQGRMLGAAALGACSLFFVLGDPVGLGDHPGASAVFEKDTHGWLRVAAQLRDQHRFESGRDLAGARVNPPYLIGAGLAPDVLSDQELLTNVRAKQQAGADFFMTQPIFTTQRLLRFLDRYQSERSDRELDLIVGIAALPSLQAAERLRAFPGIVVPDDLLRALADTPLEAQPALGLNWALELVEALRMDTRVRGILIYPLAEHAGNVLRVAQGVARAAVAASS